MQVDDVGRLDARGIAREGLGDLPRRLVEVSLRYGLGFVGAAEGSAPRSAPGTRSQSWGDAPKRS
jgi:hypothetical protein